ncbi:Semaphorin-5B [Bagarius yarrelli]|uniref:Semaphorin-2A n=1 Tax=Bagarius yarrelli TaxID=175774 RepID=A0A556TR86_BAGYA|nr:Semaphorin-5B [Bagarius yarrelli]
MHSLYMDADSLLNRALVAQKEQGLECGVDEDTRRSCRSKGKTEDECQNYMRVLLLNDSRLFSCGTNAFSPICTTRSALDLAHVIETVNGVARCPYDPKHNSTAMVTESGDLYAATVIDFSGRDPVIYRSLGNMPPLRTAQYNSKWLNEPQFVSAYEVGRFTYFFLREVAVEEDCGKAVFSRVARVCQNDVGGRFLLEDTWTTFMKARLNCSRSGDVPFYYHELHSTFYLPEQDLIYGIFTTNINSIAASAVCAFNLSAITQAFNGPFRYQENPRMSWLSTPNPIPNFQCGTVGDSGPGGNLTERSLQDAQRLFLMSEVVQPISVDPLISQDNTRFSKLVVDIVQGRDTLYHVIYIGTEHGTIIKALSSSSQNLHGCYLEEMKLLPADQQEPILNLQILQSDRECLYARDPYCGWDRKQRRCTTIEASSNMSQWSQNITQCPEQNLTRDGGFSSWSTWQSCTNDDGGETSSTCLCRSRACDHPAPRCGGAECLGPTMEVTNCSRLCNEDSVCPVPVSWAQWTSWSTCTAVCGGGFQSRLRTCEKGNSCLGCPQEYRTCNLEACPEVRRFTPWSSWYTVNVTMGGVRQEQRVRHTCRAPLADTHLLQLGKRKAETRHCPSDGGAKKCETDDLVHDLVSVAQALTPAQGVTWLPWETWSSCSKECSRGFRTRKRSCVSADGKSSAFLCSGTPVEYQDCNTQPCPGGWGKWSEWTQCEDGLQYRTRVCEISPAPCKGNHTEQRPCLPKDSAGFSLFHLILTGAASFLVALLGSILVYVFLQKVYKPIQEPAVIHPNTTNHLQSKHNTSTPKNEKYTPMEFKTLNKNNLMPDESCNFYPPLPPQTNVYTTTYYAPPMGKYDFPSLDSPCRNYMHS